MGIAVSYSQLQNVSKYEFLALSRCGISNTQLFKAKILLLKKVVTQAFEQDRIWEIGVTANLLKHYKKLFFWFNGVYRDPKKLAKWKFYFFAGI